jgi:hypothetical protein
MNAFTLKSLSLEESRVTEWIHASKVHYVKFNAMTCLSTVPMPCSPSDMYRRKALFYIYMRIKVSSFTGRIPMSRNPKCIAQTPTSR